jgi:hypothetical protein
VSPKPRDLRLVSLWGIEDSTNGVAGLVTGNWRVAQREALKLCEYKRAPVTIYLIDGGAWETEAIMTP